VPHAPDLSGCALDDRYELHAVIGEGAFGRVYEGLDRRLARPVAVKVIKPWWTEDPEWVATFEREAQMLARVSDPGIVQIYDVGHAAQGLYYVAELVEGENLASRLRRGPLSPWEACGVAAQLCRALARAHAERIVHRDVKPANILLATDGRVKVGDFGVARLAEASTDGTAASIVGTPRYMAPEQGRGWPTTPATDIYSVGVVLYEMLAGRPPFTGDSVVELALNHLQDEPPPLSVRLPTSLVEITARALAKHPADRYAEGGEMADALVDARRGSFAGPRRDLPAARARTAAHPARAMAITTGGRGAAGRPADVAPPRPPRDAPPPRRPAHDDAPPDGRPDPTRPAPRMSPRRNVNPAARRRALAALGVVIVLLAGMIAGAVLLGRAAYTRVPRLTGLSSAAATRAVRRAHLKVAISRRHNPAARGRVIAQHPGPRTRLSQGSRVGLVVSSGPPPVPVPEVVKASLSDALQTLHSLGLHTSVSYVPAPGTAPGIVVRQSRGARTSVAAGTTVGLSVAETPQWRLLTTFTSGRSGAFHITGERWRMVYGMAYQGTCTWIFFCEGPTAHVVNTATGRTVTSFGLNDGSGQTRTFTTGPGTYAIQVTPGQDDANWSVQVDDYY
jgi:eukaryotic-like serine/threonine-protein kinase